MTGGERGDILNEEIRNTPRAHRDLPGLRRTEMARAAEILGIEHRWIGFMDSGQVTVCSGSVTNFFVEDVPAFTACHGGTI